MGRLLKAKRPFAKTHRRRGRTSLWETIPCRLMEALACLLPPIKRAQCPLRASRGACYVRLSTGSKKRSNRSNKRNRHQTVSAWTAKIKGWCERAPKDE